ncbi:hypothetical protein ACJW31_04G010400 [Castanea mollissima]
MNPMLQFSKRSASKVVLANSKSIQAHESTSINFETISDGSEEVQDLETIDEKLKCFKFKVSQNLPKLIERFNSSKYPPKFLVYDSIIPWALNVARQFGLDGAPFFTQSCVVNVIYYHAHQGTLQMPLEEESSISLPSIPPLGINDMPSIFRDMESQFSNFQEANWLFCNTFNELEDEVINWMTSRWPFKTIGPAIPSMYLDKRLEDDKEYGLNLFKPKMDTCMKWLDTKKIGSVVYISFGSTATLGEEQMVEITSGLKNSNCYFLWVVRESEWKKLPSNFLPEISEKGLVGSWCPQLEVLAHKAIGCFMTHCGWNSTLEALSLGVPMIAMPQWMDQTTNAKYIMDVWKVGVRIKVDEKGIATKEEIELFIREVVGGDSGKEMKRN